MEQLHAQRRLVKSPPELWAELSSQESLSRRLAEFGEIRITRVEPETTVAWEGDRVSGTVDIAPTGWGTQVTLTAIPAEEESVVAQPIAPVAAEPVAAEPAAEPVATTPHEPGAEQRPAAVELDDAPRGFFARFFRRPGAPPDPAAAIPAPPAPAPDPSPPTPGPDPMPPGPDPAPTPQPSPDPLPPQPAPGPIAPPTIEQPLGPGPAVDPERTVAILTEILDDLGAAHHRPFTRG